MIPWHVMSLSIWCLLCVSCAARQYRVLPNPPPAEEILQTAKTLLKTPYVYGGSTPESFDCAGFTQYVFKQHNIDLPRTTSRQARRGKKIKIKNLQAGDLVFFHTRGVFPRATHVGIYDRKGTFIHAGTSPPAGVRIDSLDNPYYLKRALFGRRVIY